MVYFCPWIEIVLTSTKSENPDKMPQFAAFYLIFTICQSTHLEVSSLQKVNNKMFYLHFCHLETRNGFNPSLYNSLTRLTAEGSILCSITMPGKSRNV